MRSQLVYITDRLRLGKSQTLLAVIEKNLREGVGSVYLRERDLACDCYETLARETLERCQRFQAELILPADCEFLDKMPDTVSLQAGKHTPTLKELRARFGPKRVLGYSAHSLGDVRLANLLGANYLFLSPIWNTSSKPEQKPLGLEVLREACQESEIPVYALGGVSREKLPEVLGTGALGAAMISALQTEAGICTA